MIVSNDSIMKPPYELTNTILKLITSISEKLGAVNANYLDKPSAQLRKQNRIKTIHSSVQIEGNTLSQEQITAIINNKRVVGPKEDVIEVINAINVYEQLNSFTPSMERSFLAAHKILMEGLVPKPGKYRDRSVGIVKGTHVKHLAPPFKNVPFLMKDLFHYLKDPEELVLIKSCVFHYETEFIHPFLDGNGRMGRLWQTLILMEQYPVFEFLPFETLISKNQKAYYNALSVSDKKGSSTAFIEFMLSQLDQALHELLSFSIKKLSSKERIEHFISSNNKAFSRKDYMTVFKNISSATASRDLKKGIAIGLIEKLGEKNKTMYRKL